MPVQGADRHSSNDPLGAIGLNPGLFAQLATASIVVLAMSVGSLGSVVAMRHEHFAQRASFEEEVANLETILRLNLEEQLESARNTSPTEGAFVRMDDGDLTVSRNRGTLPPGLDLDTSTLDSTLFAARDDGAPKAAFISTTSRSAIHPFLVRPSYSGSGTPRTIGERRHRFQGAHVTSLDLTALVAESFSDIEYVDLEIAGEALSDPSVGPADIATSLDVPLLDKSFRVRLGKDFEPLSLTPLTLFALGLVTALAVMLGYRKWRSDTLNLRGEIADSNAETQLLREIGSELQATLDISETLPGVAIRLSDAMSLSGIAITSLTPAGVEFDVFSFGDIRRAQETGNTLTFSLAPDGRRLGSLVVTPHRLAEGSRQLLATIATLIGSAVANSRLLDAERTLVTRLEELDGLKTDFLATISHEVRTPLASIIGFSNLLRTRRDIYSDDQVADFLDRIEKNAASLSVMLQQVLDFSRLERGALQPIPSPLDAAAVIRNVVRDNSVVLADCKIELDVPSSLAVLADRNSLERIVGNLLTNAVKFSPKGSTVRVSLNRHPSGAILVVADEGPGVPEAEREKIFERFYRGSGEGLRGTRGAGIGLAVVRELVEHLQGEVSVSAALGGGARFQIRLPLAPRGVEEESRVRTSSGGQHD